MSFAATWMDLEIIILSEVSQTEEDKYHKISLICGSLKNDTNESIYKAEIEDLVQGSGVEGRALTPYCESTGITTTC